MRKFIAVTVMAAALAGFGGIANAVETLKFERSFEIYESEAPNTIEGVLSSVKATCTSDVKVNLVTFGEGDAEVIVQSQKTAADGTFAFKNLPSGVVFVKAPVIKFGSASKPKKCLEATSEKFLIG